MFEITEVNPEDMELILKFIYGALDAIPDQRVQSLYLATERLEVGCLPDLPGLPGFAKVTCCFAPPHKEVHAKV